MKRHPVRKLQIGAHVCVKPGWLNTDLYPQTVNSVALDATKVFPFPNESFDYIFSEHQLEHIAYKDALNMLRECFRILRPGGKIRIAVPSLDRLVQLFGAVRTERQDQYIRHVTDLWYPNSNPNPCYAANAAFMNWGHRFLYDQATLQSALEIAGFAHVQFFPPGQSDDPNLTGIETRMSEIDLYETMVAQALRKKS
jgi:predicted SAM-dependent methyltransferase